MGPHLQKTGDTVALRRAAVGSSAGGGKPSISVSVSLAPRHSAWQRPGGAAGQQDRVCPGCAQVHLRCALGSHLRASKLSIAASECSQCSCDVRKLGARPDPQCPDSQDHLPGVQLLPLLGSPDAALSPPARPAPHSNQTKLSHIRTRTSDSTSIALRRTSTLLPDIRPSSSIRAPHRRGLAAGAGAAWCLAKTDPLCARACSLEHAMRCRTGTLLLVCLLAGRALASYDIGESSGRKDTKGRAGWFVYLIC